LNLGKQVNNLKDWLYEKGTSNKWSNNAKGITKGWFNSPIQDRCITRDLKWGIPVPLPGY
jgi:methionyl-tRNA synthetase